MTWSSLQIPLRYSLTTTRGDLHHFRGTLHLTHFLNGIPLDVFPLIIRHLLRGSLLTSPGKAPEQTSQSLREIGKKLGVSLELTWEKEIKQE